MVQWQTRAQSDSPIIQHQYSVSLAKISAFAIVLLKKCWPLCTHMERTERHNALEKPELERSGWSIRIRDECWQRNEVQPWYVHSTTPLGAPSGVWPKLSEREKREETTEYFSDRERGAPRWNPFAFLPIRRSCAALNHSDVSMWRTSRHKVSSGSKWRSRSLETFTK